MDEKEKKTTSFSDLFKLLTENKDRILVYPPRPHQLLYFEIHALSPHIIEQFEQFKTLCKTLGIHMESSVTYNKILKKEFKKRAKQLKIDRSVMYMEIDEMDEDSLNEMDISTDGQFGSSWYPQEHWYDWIPDYEKSKIKFTLFKSKGSHEELVHFIKSL